MPPPPPAPVPHCAAPPAGSFPSPHTLRRHMMTAPTSNVSTRGVAGVRRSEARNRRGELSSALPAAHRGTEDVSYLTEQAEEQLSYPALANNLKASRLAKALAARVTELSKDGDALTVSEIPSQFHVFESAASDAAASTAGELHLLLQRQGPTADGRRLVFPSAKPTSRAEVYALANTVSAMLEVVKARHDAVGLSASAGEGEQRGNDAGGTLRCSSLAAANDILLFLQRVEMERGSRSCRERDDDGSAGDHDGDGDGDGDKSSIINNEQCQRLVREFLCVVDTAFAELVRQVSVSCLERGALLQHVRESIFAVLQFNWRHTDEMMRRLRRMRAQVDELKSSVIECEQSIHDLTKECQRLAGENMRIEKLRLASAIHHAKESVLRSVEQQQAEEAALSKKITDAMQQLRTVKRSRSFASPTGAMLVTKMNPQGEKRSGKPLAVHHPVEHVEKFTDTEGLEEYVDAIGGVIGRAARVQEKRAQQVQGFAADAAATALPSLASPGGAASRRRVVTLDNDAAAKSRPEPSGDSPVLPSLDLNPAFTLASPFTRSSTSSSVASPHDFSSGERRQGSSSVLSRLRRGMSVRESLRSTASFRGTSRDAAPRAVDVGAQAVIRTKTRETQCFLRKPGARDVETQAAPPVESPAPAAATATAAAYPQQDRAAQTDTVALEPAPPRRVSPTEPAVDRFHVASQTEQLEASRPTPESTHLLAIAPINWDTVAPSTEGACVRTPRARTPQASSLQANCASISLAQLLARADFLAKAKGRSQKWVHSGLTDIHTFVARERPALSGVRAVDLQDLLVQYYRNKYGLDKMSEAFVADFIVNAKKEAGGSSAKVQLFVQLANLSKLLELTPDTMLSADRGVYALYHYVWAHFRRSVSRHQFQTASTSCLAIAGKVVIVILSRALVRHLSLETAEAVSTHIVAAAATIHLKVREGVALGQLLAACDGIPVITDDSLLESDVSVAANIANTLVDFDTVLYILCKNYDVVLRLMRREDEDPTTAEGDLWPLLK